MLPFLKNLKLFNIMLVWLYITGCFHGTSREMVYSELGLESLADRCFSRRLCSFYKIINGLTLQYLLNYLLAPNMVSVALRSKPTIYPLSAVIEHYQNSFFP